MKEGRFKSLSIQEARQLADEWIRKLSQCCCQRVDVVAGVYRAKRARARGMRLSWRDGLLDGDGKTITKDPSEIVSMLSDDHG